MSELAITVSGAGTDAELTALVPEWRALCADSGNGHVFLTPGWYQAWRSIFDPRRQSQVLALRQQGRLLGIQPLLQVLTRRGPALRIGYDIHPDDDQFLGLRHRYRVLPVRQLSAPMGAESSNLRGFVLTTPEHRAACETALFRHLAGLSGWDVGVFYSESDPAPMAEAAHRAGLQTLVRPRQHQFRGIEVTTWEQYLAAKPRVFRKNMRQADNAGAGLETRICEGPHDVTAQLGELFDVAARSWKATGRDGERDHLPLTERSRRFLEQLCAQGDGDVLPLLVLLQLQGRTVAAALCLRAGARLFGSQIYYDPAVAALSPGRHMMRAMLQWASAARLAYFDLNGESRMNQYFANHTVEVSQVMVFSRAVYGRLLHRTARWAADRAQKTTPPGPEAKAGEGADAVD